MLNKPSVSIAPLPTAVKNLTRAIALSTCLGVVGFATSAQASSAFMTERVVTVKIKTSDLATEAGTEAVYTKLKSKAKRECKSDRTTLYYTGQTLSECTENLLVQLLESSQLEILQNYHLKQSTVETETLAMNAALALQN